MIVVAEHSVYTARILEWTCGKIIVICEAAWFFADSVYLSKSADSLVLDKTGSDARGDQKRAVPQKNYKINVLKAACIYAPDQTALVIETHSHAPLR